MMVRLPTGLAQRGQVSLANATLTRARYHRLSHHFGEGPLHIITRPLRLPRIKFFFLIKIPGPIDGGSCLLSHSNCQRRSSTHHTQGTWPFEVLAHYFRSLGTKSVTSSSLDQLLNYGIIIFELSVWNIFGDLCDLWLRLWKPSSLCSADGCMGGA